MGSYSTVQGDTWDKISLDLYGDERFMHRLITANPDLRDIVVFPANCLIAVPQISTQGTVTFPPWRRGA